MKKKTYPLAKDGVFLTIQGEGALIGSPMVFVRLAGCSVGCANCDTDYQVAERVSAREIAERVATICPSTVPWVWITGGEPCDHDLFPLLTALRRLPCILIALATSGHQETRPLSHPLRVDWLSVSPHDLAAWKVRSGHEVKLVAGLNGLKLADAEPYLADMSRLFVHRFVAPCAGRPETVGECRDFVLQHPGWRMTGQLHKAWGLP